MRPLLALAAAFACLLPAQAWAREVCFLNPHFASHGERTGWFYRLEDPRCVVEPLSLRFQRSQSVGQQSEGDVRPLQKAQTLKKFGFFNMSPEADCRRAAKGAAQWLDYPASTIQKLNATGDVALPAGSVIVKFNLIETLYFEYPGSCADFRSAYGGLTDKKDYKAREALGKKIDVDTLVDGFIRLGEALENNGRR